MSFKINDCQQMTLDPISQSPDSYDLDLTDVAADSGGETEAGTVQRDVVRQEWSRLEYPFP